MYLRRRFKTVFFISKRRKNDNNSKSEWRCFKNKEFVDIYVLDREIGKFEKEITNLPTAISYTITADNNNKQLNFSQITLNANGKSIVLVDRESN